MAKIEVEIVVPARHFLSGLASEDPKVLESQIADCLNLPKEYVKVKRD